MVILELLAAIGLSTAAGFLWDAARSLQRNVQLGFCAILAVGLFERLFEGAYEYPFPLVMPLVSSIALTYLISDRVRTFIG